jgi:hypothetical protein
MSSRPAPTRGLTRRENQAQEATKGRRSKPLTSGPFCAIMPELASLRAPKSRWRAMQAKRRVSAEQLAEWKGEYEHIAESYKARMGSPGGWEAKELGIAALIVVELLVEVERLQKERSSGQRHAG